MFNSETIYEDYIKYKKNFIKEKNLLDKLILYINKLPHIQILELNNDNVCVRYFEYEVKGAGKHNSIIEKLDLCMYRIDQNYDFIKRRKGW